MIYLYELKDHLSAMVRLMISSHMAYIDVAYKGKLYRFHMEDLNIAVPKQRPKKIASGLDDKIDAKKCPKCKRLMLNNVCMNPLCSVKLTT
jgi:hypothetical protein